MIRARQSRTHEWLVDDPNVDVPLEAQSRIGNGKGRGRISYVFVFVRGLDHGIHGD